ncbi:hypothetical protein M407DRAFT_48980, partial [Tulasnella calospora MUT 4182]
SELIWLARYQYLKERGYLVRQRYRPGWAPTWKVRPDLTEILCEDSIRITNPSLLDAQRISDGLFVMLKEVHSSSSEAFIARFLSSELLRNDPRNHAVPVLDVFPDPLDDKKVLLVFPLLRHVQKPPFLSIPEALDLIEQTLEGLVFLHEHEVAHRDCALGNIMMDARAMYPVPWHPQSPSLDQGNRMIMNIKSRTDVGGVRYFFTDFGLSSKGEGKTVGFDGIERAPELSYNIPYDPYRLDVYILGKQYQALLFDNFVNVGFLHPLINQMITQDPNNRPSAAEAYTIFVEMRARLNPGWFSRRLRTKDEGATIA